MSPKHSSLTRSRRDRNHQVWARAPYNFVPLPEMMVAARQPFAHDIYHAAGLTGTIECEMETCSPTYVRGLMTEAQYRVQGQKAPDELTPEEKLARAPFYGPLGDQIEGYPRPVIPGSTLRGMIRTLVEIAGYGRMRWVADEPTFTFRAVAASRDDPLRAPYQEMLGRYGSEVKAGYLRRKGDAWEIQPARTPRDVGLGTEKGRYFKVKERAIPADAIQNYVRLNSPNYRPTYYKVTFDAEVRQGKSGPYVAITQIGSPEIGAQRRHQGVLVCSGNMLETNQDGPSPRKSHALILLANSEKPLGIPEQTVRDYLAGLTPFQKQLWGGANGCLVDGGPVFYVERNGEVLAFGHSPNFRVPALLRTAQRAATPRDFVPEALTAAAEPDLADAIFGWVEEVGGGPIGHRAGRVSVGDAHFVEAAHGVWFKPEPIAPHVLSGPKPTTFQHYLVQDRTAGHDPDDKASLAHYGTSPLETQVRGHKLYWHKGAAPDIEASPSERKHESQLTRIIPLQAGVRFRFTLHFENLWEEELGALLWALTLPGAPDKVYHHKLGMGKPLGMGAVAIQSKLWLTNRESRYRRLFAGDRWDEAASETAVAPYIESFEQHVLKTLGSSKERLYDLERIQMLLAMLEWRADDKEWAETARYMEIEHGFEKTNEYKERPVLPDPLAVVADQPVQPPSRQGDRQVPATIREREELPPGYRRGKVKSFGLGPNRSYGFIIPDNGDPEIFVHQGQLAKGVTTLQENQPVIYREGHGMKGPQAEDVRPV